MLLRRSSSNAPAQAEPQPKTLDETEEAAAGAGAGGSAATAAGHASLSTTSSRQSSLHTPFKSPSKFSVHDSIREEEHDDQFHDAEANPRPSTTLTSSTSARAPNHRHSVDDDDDDDQRHALQSRHGTSAHSDKPSLTVQCATPEASKPTDAEYVPVVVSCHALYSDLLTF